MGEERMKNTVYEMRTAPEHTPILVHYANHRIQMIIPPFN